MRFCFLFCLCFTPFLVGTLFSLHVLRVCLYDCALVFVSLICVQMSLIAEKRQEIRDALNDHVFPMLERWCDRATKTNDITLACSLHAHLAFLYLHIPHKASAHSLRFLFSPTPSLSR